MGGGKMMEIRVNCNKCGDVGGHKYINSKTNLYYCFRCGDKGKSKKSIIAFKTQPKLREIEMFSLKLKTKISENVLKYMESRIPNKELLLTKVRWSPDLPDRAILPIWAGGKVKFWTARSISNAEPKFLSSGKKSNFVYNINDTVGWATLCEGPLDALSCPNGIAIFGKHPSEIQLKLIISKFHTVYIALDGDAVKDRKKLVKILLPYVKVKEVDFGKDEDPCSVGFEEMVNRIRKINL